MPRALFFVALGGFDISIAESSSTCCSRVVDVNPSFSISQGGLWDDLEKWYERYKQLASMGNGIYLPTFTL